MGLWKSPIALGLTIVDTLPASPSPSVNGINPARTPWSASAQLLGRTRRHDWVQAVGDQPVIARF